MLPHLRRQRIASALLDEAETRIAARSPTAGIGFGLYPDYGPAQRLYVLRGYVPDGRGVAYAGRTAAALQAVANDDELVLYLIKQLR